ncbi:hypothetical protein [Terrihabitans sp. B22-R8]|uniref:hypothetical protein n=1 Tax=Terrihabitans sp. B22-R8 TaxID=3425128 RepID=UPI00403CD48E
MRQCLVLTTVLLAASPAMASSLALIPAKGHPVEDYQRARDLFASGDKEMATCLFYRGQYRFRVRLKARPELDPAGEPAAFGALSETIGKPIRDWAGGDPAQWAASIRCALDWIETHDDPFTPRLSHSEAHREAETGLRSLLEQISSGAKQIQVEREPGDVQTR